MSTVLCVHYFQNVLPKFLIIWLNIFCSNWIILNATNTWKEFKMSYQSLVHRTLTSETHTSWELNWLVTLIIKSREIRQDNYHWAILLVIASEPALFICIARLISEWLNTPVNASLSHPTPSQTIAGYLTGQGFANVFKHLSPRDQPFGFLQSQEQNN